MAVNITDTSIDKNHQHLEISMRLKLPLVNTSIGLAAKMDDPEALIGDILYAMDLYNLDKSEALSNFNHAIKEYREQ